MNFSFLAHNCTFDSLCELLLKEEMSICQLELGSL